MKQTPLFEEHEKLGAKLAPFGGWKMPISYSSVLSEHAAVRSTCGVFDVSHMGEIFVSGKDALAFMQYVTINDASRLKHGGGQYTALCNENGGMIDDLIIYRLKEDEFLICANAANIEKDYEWLVRNKGQFDIALSNRSDEFAQIAIQGPNATEALKLILDQSDFEKFAALKYMQIDSFGLLNGEKILIARTGYTGEKGYEIYLENRHAQTVWTALIADEGQVGTQPIGLAARDTLRLEACYLLYGNDMDESVSPLEAGIGWATKLEKDNFIGKSSLCTQKEQGPDRQLVAFKMNEKGIPRSGMAVLSNGKQIGKVTSGSVLPTVGGAGGLALVDVQACKVGGKLDIDVRGKRLLATIVDKPIYSVKVKS